MTGPVLAAALLIAAPAGASEFLEALHRADARAAQDPERVEFATRAIRAWKPSDGDELLADAYFRRGEGEFEAWNDAAAGADLGLALAHDARNWAALLLRGRSRLRAGRYADAERDFLDYTAARADDGEGWLGLAEARVSRGLPRADKPALAALVAATKLLDADDPRPKILEGRAHAAAGRRLEALNSLDAAVSCGKGHLAEALAWRARVKADLRDPRGARDDGGRAAAAFEDRLDELLRVRAPAKAQTAARERAADARFRRGAVEETLSLPADALEDYRDACDLGRADACARAAALTPRDAPPEPKPRKRRWRSNPSGDSGTRIYAN
jgi:tetratricopeptide (TPR) repeat protein